MMKAAVVTSFTEPLKIIEVPKPELGPNDILVKNIACGVCHSDLHLAKGDWDIKPPLPRIVGHEGVGEIVDIGSNVTNNQIKKGDLVGVPWIQKTCLHCEYCLTGRETLCLNQRNSGFAIDGCFAEYSIVDANFATKLPSGMDPYTSAPLFCAGVTVYKALKVSQARPGQWVGIIGIGGLGSLAVAYARAMGFRVFAVVAPNDQAAVQLSKEMGAEQVYDGPSELCSQTIVERTDGGVEAILVTVPSLNAYDQALKSIKRGGRLVCVGLPNGKMFVPIVDCVLNGIEIVGSVVGTRQDLQEALQLAQLHRIVCKIQKKKLEDINDIFNDMIHYRINGRIVLDFANN